MKTYALFLAWLIALIALVSTLFAQYNLGWAVCPLCWYQRIALYPLVILLGMAAFRDDNNIIPYALPFPIIGFLFAAYQYCEQMIPGFAPIDFCKQDIPCDTIHLKIAGFITLPFLSALACILIFILLRAAQQQRND